MRAVDEQSTPVELRFIDLFLLVIAALVFVALVLLLQGLGASAPLSVTTRNLPHAVAGRDYELALAAIGGVPPLDWRLAEGALPAGFRFERGVIRGRAAGATSAVRFAVEVGDSAGHVQRATLSLRALSLTASSQEDKPRFVRSSVQLPDGRSQAPYSSQLRATGGSPPYRWTVTGGKPPEGLVLSESGTLRGRPNVAPPSPLGLVISTRAMRQTAKRELGTHTFTAEVSDVSGGRALQRVSVYAEPTPYSFFWRLMTGDLPADANFLLEALSAALRFLFCAAIVYLFLTLSLPIAMLLLGFEQQRVPGWRGVMTGPSLGPPEGWPPPRPLVPLAVTVRKVINFAQGIAMVSGVIFAAAWGAIRQVGEPAAGETLATPKTTERDARHSAPEPERSATERKSVWARLLEWLRGRRENRRRRRPSGVPARKGSGGGRGACGAASPEAGDHALANVRETSIEPSRVENLYLESLRHGGTVRWGGSFLALPFLTETGLPNLLSTAFRPLPDVGRGLSHAAFDEFFVALLGLRRSRATAGRADPRFDVVQGRLGPAILPRPAGQNQERRPKPPAPDLEVTWPGKSDASRQDERAQAMVRTGKRARRWLLRAIASESGGSKPRRLLRGLLRSTVHVRLEEDLLVVRLKPAATTRGRELMQRLLSYLNQRQACTLGVYSFPIKFLAEPEPPHVVSTPPSDAADQSRG